MSRKTKKQYKNFKQIIKELWDIYPGESAGGWRVVSETISTPEITISKGMCHQIAANKIEPKREDIREFFNLPPLYDHVAGCPDCGDLHLPAKCPHNRSKSKPRYRPDIDPDLTDDQKKFVSSMSIEERTKRLLDGFCEHENASIDLTYVLNCPDCEKLIKSPAPKNF